MLNKLYAATMATTLTIAAAPAVAQSTMDAFFNNTLVMTMADGAKIRMFINADDTYSGVTADGSKFFGVWELKDDKACFTRQPANHAPTCEDYPGKKVGDSWEGTINAGDATVAIELVEGR